MARQNHTSINIDQATAIAVDERRRDGETRTTRIGQDLTDYYALLDAGLRRARLTLTPAEAALIIDVQNSVLVQLEHWASQALAHQVEDGISLDGLAEKWQVDGEALVAKLAGLGDIACIALGDWAARFWARENPNLEAAISIFKGAA